jgi:hypothetical protein
MIPAIPIIMALAQAVGPSVVGLLTGSKTAGKAAEMISQTARALTGASTDDAALEILKDNPAKMIEYKAAMNEHAATIAVEETKRLKIENETIRVEYENADPYVRRMRPTFGYGMVFCMVLMFVTATGVMLFSSVEKGVQVIVAYSSMQWIIVAGLTALGVYIKKRSDDKAGGGALGLVGSLMRKMRKVNATIAGLVK